MSTTTFLPIGTGWRTPIGYVIETTYQGTLATGTVFLWPGVVQSLTETLNQNPFTSFRIDGNTRYPVYILQGQREPSLSLVYWPQDVTSLTTFIVNVSSQSTAIGVNNLETGTQLLYTGLRPDRIDIAGTVGQPISVTVSLQGAQVTGGLSALPVGYSFTGDSGNTPWYWAQSAIIVAGTSIGRAINFTLTIANSLNRVYTFNQLPTVRSIALLTGTPSGSMTVTYENLTDYNNVINLTNNNISLQVIDASAVTHTITFLSAEFTQYTKPQTLTDIIAVTIPFTAKGVSVV